MTYVVGTIRSISDYTLYTLYRFYMKAISANIQLKCKAWCAVDHTESKWANLKKLYICIYHYHPIQNFWKIYSIIKTLLRKFSFAINYVYYRSLMVQINHTSVNSYYPLCIKTAKWRSLIRYYVWFVALGHWPLSLKSSLETSAYRNR
jgi:hypothetical protein